MCKPANEGGQRCASHTRKAWVKAQDVADDARKVAEKAERKWDRDGGNQDDWAAMNDLTRASLDAQGEASNKAIEFASTPSGAKHFRGLREQAAAASRAGSMQGAASGVYYDHILKKGAEMREANQVAGAQIKAAAAKKTARAQDAVEPAPTHPDGKMVSADDLNYGDRFIDPDSGDVVELHRLVHTSSDGSDEVETTAGWTVTIKAGQKVEKVPDGTPTTGDTFEDYKSDYSASYHPNAMTEGVFETEYQPAQYGDDQAVLDYPPTNVDPKTVWTIVEGEHDYQYAVPGVQKINALGYIETKKPWVTGAEEAVWVDGSEFTD